VPRTLSVSRTTVSRGAEPQYLTALGELASCLRARGESLWLLRHPTLPGTFLEFSESPSPERHRSRVARSEEEAALEGRLRTLAAYAPDAWILWEEVPLERR
jgi:hypothetical protein